MLSLSSPQNTLIQEGGMRNRLQDPGCKTHSGCREGFPILRLQLGLAAHFWFEAKLSETLACNAKQHV